MGRFVRKFLLFLCAACILAGIAARFLLLNASYEYDELFTAVTSNPALSFGWIWTNWLMPDVHPPLHNFLLYIYNHFVPYGPECWLRLPSVLLGLGALAWAWFGFPKRFGKTARLLFVGMLSCQAYGIFYAQHARAYALVLFLSVPLTFVFLDIARAALKGRNVPAGQWAAYGILSLLLCWSHYFGALLYGVYSVLLLGLAVKYKRRLWLFICVPGLVFLLFLPWLLPNLWANISLQRFDGAWWGNRVPSDMIMPGLVVFFFSCYTGHLIVMVLLLAGLQGAIKQYRRRGCFAYETEVALLTLACLTALAIVGLLYIKIYLFFGRYFMPFVPAMYLLCSLLAAPIVRRHLWALGLFVLFLIMNLTTTGMFWVLTSVGDIMPARMSMQAYRELWPEKELFVVALEAFPPSSMEAMYAFYPNQVFGMNTRVTELWQMDEPAREKALARRENAVIWMPNCNTNKLAHLTQKWDRAAAVELRVKTSCFLKLADKGTRPPPDWHPADEQYLQDLEGW